jgi:hypothetical protein
VSDAGFKKTFGLGLEMPEGMDGNGPLVDQEAGAQQLNLFRDVTDKGKTPFKSSRAFFYMFSKLTAYNGRLAFFFSDSLTLNRGCRISQLVLTARTMSYICPHKIYGTSKVRLFEILKSISGFSQDADPFIPIFLFFANRNAGWDHDKNMEVCKENKTMNEILMEEPPMVFMSNESAKYPETNHNGKATVTMVGRFLL